MSLAFYQELVHEKYGKNPIPKIPTSSHAIVSTGGKGFPQHYKGTDREAHPNPFLWYVTGRGDYISLATGVTESALPHPNTVNVTVTESLLDSKGCHFFANFSSFYDIPETWTLFATHKIYETQHHGWLYDYYISEVKFFVRREGQYVYINAQNTYMIDSESGRRSHIQTAISFGAGVKIYNE